MEVLEKIPFKDKPQCGYLIKKSKRGYELFIYNLVSEAWMDGFSDLDDCRLWIETLEKKSNSKLSDLNELYMLLSQRMKRFKPFTPNYEKKTKRADYWYSMMSELAYINGLTVDLKEKYGRMDATMFRGDEHHLVTETMEDYEAMSEERCMYCNRHCKQYWTHEDSWLIHLCLPCLIGDKITILLEKIIRRWNNRGKD